MIESDITSYKDVNYRNLFADYNNPSLSDSKRNQIREQLLNTVIELPETIEELTIEFGPEAVYSRLNQMNKDLLIRQGYSELNDLVSTYNKLEAISQKNKGLNSNINEGQVTLFNGQFTISETDLVLNGRVSDFKFTRTYKSNVIYTGPLGANWDHNYNLWLRVENGGESIARSTGSLREDTYIWNAIEGVYEIPNGFYGKLTKDSILISNIGNLVSRYILETAIGTKYIYKDIPNSNGLQKVEFIIDRHNNAITFQYDNDNNGVLEKIIDTLGKEIEFIYDDHKRIIEIREDDRSFLYCYDDKNDLICVEKPSLGIDKEPSINRYEYSSYDKPKDFLHNLEAIVDPEGNRYLENDYGIAAGVLSYNRIIRQRIGRGEILYGYLKIDGIGSGEDEINLPANKTNVTKYNGQIVEHEFNSQGNLLNKIECCKGISQVFRRIVTRYKYNEDGMLTEIIDPLGNITRKVYYRDWFGITIGNSPDLESRRKFGNLLKIIKQGYNSNTNLVTPIIDYNNDIITEYEYDNLFNQITSKSDPRDKDRKIVSVYSNNSSGTISADYEGQFLRRIIYPETKLPNGETQIIKKEFEYNQYGQLKIQKTFRNTVIENNSVTIKNQPLETCVKYYYFGETETDEPGVTDEPFKNGYLHLVKQDAGVDTSDRHFLNIKTIFDIDWNGNIKTRTNGRGHTTTYDYDKLDRLTITTLPLHQIKNIKYYDKNNRIIRIENDLMNSDGHFKQDKTLIIEQEFDCVDNIIKKKVGIDSSKDERVTNNYYSVSNQLCKVKNPKGNIERFQYNERDLLRNETKGFTTIDETKLEYIYDEVGRVVKIINGNGFETKFEYDEFSRLYKQKDSLGNITNYIYDKLNNVIERSFIDKDDKLLSKIQYDYDEIGRLLERRKFWFKIGEDHISTPIITHFYFDEENNSLRIIEDTGGLNSKIDCVFDSLGRQIKTIDNLGNEIIHFYDDNSNLTRIIENETKESGLSEVFVRENEFDELNRLRSFTDNLGNITRYYYDSQNNIESIIDGLENTIRYDYDVFGQKTLEIYELKKGSSIEEIKIHFNYDSNGLLIQVFDAKSNLTTYNYDSLDRIIETTYTDGSTEKKEYDKNGNILKETDCNSLVKSFKYDELDRLKLVEIDKSNVYPELIILGPNKETFNYDGSGRIINASNQNSVINFTFDSFGNLIQEDQNGKFVESTFNPLGFREKLIYSHGRIITYIPDCLNRIERIINEAGGTNYPGEAPTNSILLTNIFVGLYRLWKRNFENGVIEIISYDGNKRPISILYTGNGTSITEIQSLYDAVGNKRFENIIKNSGNCGDFYDYDSLYRLTKVEQELNIGLINTSNYEPQSSIERISLRNAPNQTEIDNFINSIVLPNIRKVNFEYDSVGNRLTKKKSGDPTIKYNSNDLNQYVSIDITKIFYDKNGNIVKDGQFKYYYDYENRLVRVEDEINTIIAEYFYDPLGRRIKKFTNGKQTTFLYDGKNVIEEIDERNKILAQYILGNGVDDIIMMSRDSKDYYYLRNSLGNVIGLSGKSSSIVEEYVYSPFGIVNHLSGIGNPYFFTGRRIDSETRLMYYRARHYSPSLGRYLQRDPLGYIDSLNLYEYVRNNPLRYRDFEGKTAADVANAWEKSGWSGTLGVFGITGENITKSVESVTTNLGSRVLDALPQGKDLLSVYIREQGVGAVSAAATVASLATSVVAATADPPSMIRGVMRMGETTAEGVEQIKAGNIMMGTSLIIGEAAQAAGIALGGAYSARIAGVTGSPKTTQLSSQTTDYNIPRVKGAKTTVASPQEAAFYKKSKAAGVEMSRSTVGGKVIEKTGGPTKVGVIKGSNVSQTAHTHPKSGIANPSMGDVSASKGSYPSSAKHIQYGEKWTWTDKVSAEYGVQAPPEVILRTEIPQSSLDAGLVYVEKMPIP